MIERKQLYRHEPWNEIYGDCHRTAFACLLGLEPHEVPHFALLHTTTPGYDVDVEIEKWLRTLGLAQVDILYSGKLEDVFGFMGARNPDALYLLGGTSPRGTNHTVVCQGGGFRWDPAQAGGYLVGPLDHGFYEVTFLVPVGMMGGQERLTPAEKRR